VTLWSVAASKTVSTWVRLPAPVRSNKGGFVFRDVHEMTADELLQELDRGKHHGKSNAVHQIELFTRMGGDPNDHNYARLSFLTKELRERGVAVGSSRHSGIWLD
jgi:hypothetical protein